MGEQSLASEIGGRASGARLPQFLAAEPSGVAGQSSAKGQELFWIALTGIVAAFVLLVLKPGRERLREAEAEVRLLEVEIRTLEERISHLRGWERALSAGDREAWAALARGRLGWLAPGERIVPLEGQRAGHERCPEPTRGR